MTEELLQRYAAVSRALSTGEKRELLRLGAAYPIAATDQVVEKYAMHLTNSRKLILDVLDFRLVDQGLGITY